MANWFKKLLGSEDKDTDDSELNDGIDDLEDINLDLESDKNLDELNLNDLSEDLDSEDELIEEEEEEEEVEEEEEESYDSEDDTENFIKEMLQNDIDSNNIRKSKLSDLQKKINELKKQQGID